MGGQAIETSIAPWLAVADGARAAPASGGVRPIRIILTVNDPDGAYERKEPR